MLTIVIMVAGSASATGCEAALREIVPIVTESQS
jgi:hypothetical protein